jgi:hypothetical protein
LDPQYTHQRSIACSEKVIRQSSPQIPIPDSSRRTGAFYPTAVNSPTRLHQSRILSRQARSQLGHSNFTPIGKYLDCLRSSDESDSQRFAQATMCDPYQPSCFGPGAAGNIVEPRTLLTNNCSWYGMRVDFRALRRCKLGCQPFGLLQLNVLTSRIPVLPVRPCPSGRE